jgi:hypothetical protein
MQNCNITTAYTISFTMTGGLLNSMNILGPVHLYAEERTKMCKFTIWDFLMLTTLVCARFFQILKIT